MAHENVIPTHGKNATASASESENPAISAPTQKPTRPRTNKDWWPNQLDLSVLHQHSSLSSPIGEEFSYQEAFKGLDVESPGFYCIGISARHLAQTGRAGG